MTNRTCCIDGCTRPHNSRGYCRMHAKRIRNNGDPLKVRRIASYAGQECSVEGCTEQPRRGGLCPSHSEQMRTHGDPLLWVRAPAGAGSLRKDGYRLVTVHGHPLAESGQLLEHRKVLYDAIGPGEHPCRWCGQTLTWQAGITETALVADHLDFDRANNDPSNLVPSCNGCNVRRTTRWLGPKGDGHQLASL